MTSIINADPINTFSGIISTPAPRIDVVLVNEQDGPIGVMEKLDAHRKGVLHRAFSVYIFDSRRKLLLQKRALTKYHCGGLWTNTCCGHPLPGEDVLTAADRRLQEEMGFTTPLQKMFEYRYQTPLDNGLIENEYLHVFYGVYDGIVKPDESEAADYGFLPLEEIQKSMEQRPDRFTPWFHLVFPRVASHPQLLL